MVEGRSRLEEAGVVRGEEVRVRKEEEAVAGGGRRGVSRLSWLPVKNFLQLDIWF